MHASNSVDVGRATADPASVFDHPADVVQHPDLRYAEKVSILQAWRAKVGVLGTVPPDGKPEAERTLGDEVVLALQELEADRTVDPRQPDQAPQGAGYRPVDRS